MYHKYNDSNIDKIRSSLEKRNIQMVFSDEDCYPTLLKEIYDYPLVLLEWVKCRYCKINKNGYSRFKEGYTIFRTNL